MAIPPSQDADINGLINFLLKAHLKCTVVKRWFVTSPLGINGYPSKRKETKYPGKRVGLKPQGKSGAEKD